MFLLSGAALVGTLNGLQQISAGISPSPSIKAEQFDPTISTTEIATNRAKPWDVVELPSGEILFTQKGGSITRIKNKQTKQVAQLSQVHSKGEGGLMGMAVDPKFTENNYIYVYYNVNKDNKHRVYVTRYVYKNDKLSNRKDLITSIPANSSGRHSGCQLETGRSGNSMDWHR